MPPKITIRRKTPIPEQVEVSKTKTLNFDFGKILLSQGLNEQQVNTILNLKYPDGNKIISYSNPLTNVEIINLLKQKPFEEVVNYLRKVENKKQLILDSPLLQKEKERIEIKIENLQKVIEAETGEYKCQGCGSERTISRQKQIRSADEGMSTLVRCIDCGRGWRID